LLAELLVVYGHKRLAAAHALLLDVGGSDGRVQRVQLCEQPIARLDKLALTAQLVQTLIAVANLFVQPTERVAQLPLDAAKRTCQGRDATIEYLRRLQALSAPIPNPAIAKERA
jgi:hypothetical protein